MRCDESHVNTWCGVVGWNDCTVGEKCPDLPPEHSDSWGVLVWK